MKTHDDARSDIEVLEAVRAALLAEPLLGDCVVRPNGHDDEVRAAVLFPEGCRGCIHVRVDRGVVRLEGVVGSAGQRRLASERAGAASGSHRLVNALELTSRPD